MLIVPTVVTIAGTIASGKTTAANWLESQYHAYSTRASKHLKKIASERGFDTDRATLQHLSASLRKQFGQDYLAHLVCQELEAVEARTLFVIDVRRVADVSHLYKWAKSRGYRFQLIFIRSTFKLSWQRDCARRVQQGEKPLTQTEFWQCINHECEGEISQLLAMTPAHAIIPNFGNDPEAFQQSVSRALELPHPKAAVI